MSGRPAPKKRVIFGPKFDPGAEKDDIANLYDKAAASGVGMSPEDRRLTKLAADDTRFQANYLRTAKVPK